MSLRSNCYLLITVVNSLIKGGILVGTIEDCVNSICENCPFGKGGCKGEPPQRIEDTEIRPYWEDVKVEEKTFQCSNCGWSEMLDFFDGKLQGTEQAIGRTRGTRGVSRALGQGRSTIKTIPAGKWFQKDDKIWHKDADGELYECQEIGVK